MYQTYPLIRSTPQGSLIQFEIAETAVAITPSGSAYTRLTQNFLHSCNHADIWLCPPTQAIMTRNLDSCIFALFRENADEINAFCEHKIITKPPPLFVNLYRTTFWLYNVPQQLELKEECGYDYFPQRPARQLLGAGFLEITPGCSGRFEALGVEIPAISQSSRKNLTIPARTIKVFELNNTYTPPSSKPTAEYTELMTQLKSVLNETGAPQELHWETVNSLHTLATTHWMSAATTGSVYNWASWLTQGLIILAITLFLLKKCFPDGIALNRWAPHFRQRSYNEERLIHPAVSYTAQTQTDDAIVTFYKGTHGCVRIPARASSLPPPTQIENPSTRPRTSKGTNTLYEPPKQPQEPENPPATVPQIIAPPLPLQVSPLPEPVSSIQRMPLPRTPDEREPSPGMPTDSDLDNTYRSLER